MSSIKLSRILLSDPNRDGNCKGWGQYLGQYLSVTVVNKAIAGRSARSYTDEGRFTTLIDTVSSGDYVVIEFGHNDGLSGTVDNGRQDAYGMFLLAPSLFTSI